MAELIVKNKSEYKNVLEQEDNIVENIDLTNVELIDFTTGYKLDENQWFKITDFSSQDYYVEVCNASFSTASLLQIANNEYESIKEIVILQDEQIHFQRVTPSYYIYKRKVLDCSGSPKVVEYRKQIEIKEESDAIYLLNTDTLLFKDISKIKPIFKGIEILHREAMQEEVDEFMEHEFISSLVEPERVGLQNRKRIADIGEKYAGLSTEKRQQLITYARENSGIEIEEGKFQIKNDNDLKNLLYAMDQRYYYADIYDENRIANSVRVLSRNVS